MLKKDWNFNLKIVYFFKIMNYLRENIIYFIFDLVYQLVITFL